MAVYPHRPTAPGEYSRSLCVRLRAVWNGTHPFPVEAEHLDPVVAIVRHKDLGAYIRSLTAAGRGTELSGACAAIKLCIMLGIC